ncbi:MAG: acyltransferase [Flavobacterium sp.]|nr:acyltransferase [Flavobacterium sp.]
MKRIQFLDGFRGLAIIWVVLFHTFSRWTTLMPYGENYKGNLFIDQGFLAIYLFFLISGFVILLTLERSKNFITFLKNRWIRLFPSMLICGLIIYFTGSFFYERPNGIPNLVDLIPGLTFIDPFFYNQFTPLKVGILEGAFWSIFVEVKFYIFFGLMYFYLGSRKAIAGIFGMFLIYNVVFYTNALISNQYLKLIEMVFYKLGFSYFGWFTTGALVYFYFNNKNFKTLLLSLLIGVLSVIGLRVSNIATVIALLILILFVATVKYKFLQKVVDNKIFLLMGIVSYPYYLIHENITVASIIKTNKYLPEMPYLVLVFVPVLMILLFAYPYSKFIEPKIQKKLKLILIKK